MASGHNGSHAEGRDTQASGVSAHAEGSNTVASGNFSHSEGLYTTSNHRSQHTFGEYNVLDPSTAIASNKGNYVEIVGNGTATNARSNARTLDWSGNEVLAGGLKINSTQDVAAQVSLTQAEYDALVQAGTVDLVNTIYFITDADAVAGSASEITYSNTASGLSAEQGPIIAKNRLSSPEKIFFRIASFSNFFLATASGIGYCSLISFGTGNFLLNVAPILTPLFHIISCKYTTIFVKNILKNNILKKVDFSLKIGHFVVIYIGCAQL